MTQGEAMTDIEKDVTRLKMVLRSVAAPEGPLSEQWVQDAAATIDALQAREKTLREALEPFAALASLWIGVDRITKLPHSDDRLATCHVGDLRRAAAALTPAQGEGG